MNLDINIHVGIADLGKKVALTVDGKPFLLEEAETDELIGYLITAVDAVRRSSRKDPE